MAREKVYDGHLLDRFQRFKMYFIWVGKKMLKIDVYTCQSLANIVQITSLCCGEVLQVIAFNM